jgi:hypothetical protein
MNRTRILKPLRVQTRLNHALATDHSTVDVLGEKAISVGWELLVSSVGRLGGRRTSCPAARSSSRRRRGRRRRADGEDDQRGTPNEDKHATEEQADREPEKE